MPSGLRRAPKRHGRAPDGGGLRRAPGMRRIRRPMKTNLHPELHEVLVHCACGETWTTRSTKKELRIEICSKCHPFFTGKQKLVDSAGRVERFRLRYEKKKAAGSPAS
jgi:large subunit ribosomal protein L31